ncbi:MAG TPA: mechanosensitive ion channel domain-containing protein [Longimicrobiales bacterium]|nr:mechanosensitive ion channel domain-containing protein [Longimicrobiales bacterium]
MTGLFLVVLGAPELSSQESEPPPASEPRTAPAADPGEAVEEATGSVRDFVAEFTAILPKVLIALGLIVAAALLIRLLRTALRALLRRWEKADAATALTAVLIWLLAIGAALSVISGDARALVGSVGLLGLALSWALQAPIESFAGWLVNSFKGYYRVGDRIAVGEVFGDVYRIDSLTTTVWEAGGPDKPVQGAQPTGALITFPNSEVLRANIVNYTRGFPYVWDEVTIGVANESDIRYAAHVIAEEATRVLGSTMADPINRYRRLLQRERLDYDIAEEPQVYVSMAESWTDITVRYLVPARERRQWSSTLLIAIGAALADRKHAGRIVPSYPVRRVELSRTEERGAG